MTCSGFYFALHRLAEYYERERKIKRKPRTKSTSKMQVVNNDAKTKDLLTPLDIC